ncbi:MAG TPA: GDP-mannose 4,6-dehydratase, partial [bacterium]|nr:GDP-mannose 4,6-dehydratase [bacterium]
HRSHGLDTRVVRIFNTYGPRMRVNDGRVVPAFCSQALLGEPITVFGDGSQTRCFTFVDDLVDGIIKLLEADYHDPVNIGNPREMSMLEYARLIINITGSKSEIIYSDIPVDDPKKRMPDISVAKKVLGWQPRTSVEEGMKKTLPFFEETLRKQGRL